MTTDAQQPANTSTACEPVPSPAPTPAPVGGLTITLRTLGPLLVVLLAAAAAFFAVSHRTEDNARRNDTQDDSHNTLQAKVTAQERRLDLVETQVATGAMNQQHLAEDVEEIKDLMQEERAARTEDTRAILQAIKGASK